MSFKPGDVVQLKSTGPLMTVIKNYPADSDGPSVECVWFHEFEVRKGFFVEAVLKSRSDMDR